MEQFGERCVRVNTMFDMIISSNENLQIDPNYLQSLRDDAGLDKDDVSGITFLNDTIEFDKSLVYRKQ